MLIGAGDAGAIALLEFQNSQHSSNQVVCIIDDASRKRGQLLRGVPIVGGRESILAAAEKIPHSGNRSSHSFRQLQAAASYPFHLPKDQMHPADPARYLPTGKRRGQHPKNPQRGN